ncbi:hypothetical protein SCHPADRAFT_936603 [Schizopora paradoxa]|uniref:Retrograde transport protein Dsl1 C-terminal domain-containing protein n=1 Tax=Schizopora paradoxa TaxID=27342 RepID=A0A0H2S0U9_9AGAM|nr:hypothetical protein SCHPADRAFT_936603 [Schizopora paradoxa]
MDNLPLPEHLLRKDQAKDASSVSSDILSRMANTARSALTADLASSWVAELDRTLEDTKDRITSRIQAELVTFERQLATSKSVQNRFKNLSLNIDELEDALANETSGLLPTLLKTLNAHSVLAQETQDTITLAESLEYISECRSALASLEQHVRAGQLSEAVEEVKKLQSLVDTAPLAVSKAEVMTDLKGRLRSLNYNAQEQLSEAYSRSVKISSTSFTICSAVQVSKSQVIISLPDVLKSISPDSLASFLTSLKKELVAHFIDFPLQQHVSSSVSSATEGPPSHTFSLFPVPAHLPVSKADSNLTIGYLRSLVTYLSQHLFPCLPQTQNSAFPRTLCKPLTQGILSFVLIPSIPASLADVPTFLHLVNDAVTFEEEFIAQILSDNEEREIKNWAGNIASHYGRKRRVDLLEKARKLILAGGHGEFHVEVEVHAKSSQRDTPPPGSVLAQSVVLQDADADDAGAAEEAATAWDLEADDALEEEPNGNGHAHAGNDGKDSSSEGVDEEVAWGFDDDEATVAEQQTESNLNSTNGTSGHTNGNSNEPTAQVDENGENDDSDAWGWGEGNDNLDDSTEPQTDSITSSNDDDAWDDSWNEPQNNYVPPISPLKPVKVAKRLEKFSAKSKPNSPVLATSPQLAQNAASSPLSSSFTSSHMKSPSSLPASSSFASISSSSFGSRHGVSSSVPKSQEPVRPPQPPPKEHYTVSTLTQDLVEVVRSVLSEGLQCQRSNVFSRSKIQLKEAATPPSQLILQAAPSVLDLYRALFGVTHAEEIRRKPVLSMRFSNDCIYLSETVEKLMSKEINLSQSVKDQLRDSVQKVNGLGDWLYEDTIAKQGTLVINDLQRTEGLTDTGDPERFDDCESVMNDVLRNIRSVGYQWQKVLPRSKYLHAIGQVVESALSKVIEDILALPDIPELDSRRLSELCRILNALEGLFADDPETGSVAIDHVPSWLKYSYLTELLEASIADISYLFDEGALIDFDVTELVSVIRALFADTPLRTNTIAKLMKGHPVVHY